MEIHEFVKFILGLYNDNFSWILTTTIVALICIAINLFLKMKNEDDEKWYSFFVTSKKELLQMLMQSVIVVILIIFLWESFNIDLVSLIKIGVYWKLIIGFWIVLHLKAGRALYKKLNFYNFLDDVKRRKYYYTTPQNIFLDIIERYKTNYEFEIERLGILKSLTPVSLVPLLAGYILEGKDVIVNWNWYTIIFFVILFFYFYNVWKCYRNTKFWKLQMLEIQKELRIVESKKRRKD